MRKKRIVIVGGGFVGVKCALELAKRGLKDVHIRLISDRDNFEYHGALYRLVAGGSPLEVCLPLRDIFKGLNVDIIQDQVITVDRTNEMVIGKSGSTYGYDHLVIGLGAQTNYFGIPGLEENSLGMKTISDALSLKNHITNTLSLCPTQPVDEMKHSLRFVIVGAGPTGVELAGELAGYIRHLVRDHGLNETLVHIDLIERGERILPKLDECTSESVHAQLEKMGVHVSLNTAIESLDGDKVVLSDETVQSPTVVWTAGVKAHALIDQLGAGQDRMGRVIVPEHLKPFADENIYVGGDSAATAFSGMAQTAINDGRYIADCIARTITKPDELLKEYKPGEPIYAIPAGPGWAATQWGQACFVGRTGWMLRRLVDWKVFISFLPFRKAWGAFRSHYHSQHPIEIC